MPHPLFFKEEPEDKRNRQEVAYDEKLTGHMLARYGLSSHKSALRRVCHEVYQDNRLRIEQFVQMFNYPVNMRVAKIPGTVRNCTLDRLYNHISTRKLIEHYFTVRSEIEDEQGRSFALVTPWTYIPKGMVLHERSVIVDELPIGLKKPCVRMIWTLPKRQQKRGKYLVLEPLDQFLAGFDWKYEG
jgi:hypothetical protein